MEFMEFLFPALPFVKNPEDNPTYSVHFSRQWQDTMLVSLHNFLATIFQVCIKWNLICKFLIQFYSIKNENKLINPK